MELVAPAPTPDPAPRAPADPTQRPGRLKVGIVGAGRVGTVLGAALQLAGHRVVSASAVSDQSRRRVEALLPGVPVRPADQVAREADLLLLTVPDDALGAVARGLAETGNVHRGTLVAHASGALGVGVLAPLTAAGALPLALHPVMTFTGAPEDLARLAGVCFGITAPEALQPVAEVLVVEMGGEPVFIAEEDRPLYHAALANGANHLVALVATSADLLRAAGVPDPSRMLGPLVGAALDNVLRAGDAALTGPVARGDAGTVGDHLRALGRASPEALAAYVAMARLTADRALAAGRLDPVAAEALLDVLSGVRPAGNP